MTARIYRSPQSLNSRPALSLSQAGQKVAVRGAFPVGGYTNAAGPVLSPGAASNPLGLNDTIVLLKWPANTVIEDIVADFDRIDSDAAPAAILQFGVMNAALTGLVRVLLACTAAQSKIGGVLRTGTSSTLVNTDMRAIRHTPSAVDRYIGALVQTAPATGVAQASAASTMVNRGKWVAGTAYALSDYLYLPNGQIVYVTTAGNSGASEPDWATGNPAGVGDTTTDGTVTWTADCPVIGLTATFRPV